MNIRHTVRAIIVAGGAGIATGGGAQAAFAADAAAGSDTYTLEEIVVTARKASERLLDVPLAITAFSSEEITQRGIANLDDIAAATPGLTFSNLQGEFLPTPIIRGFAPIDVRGENNAAIFVDGIYVSGREGLNFAQLDLERIEIVKGPQAALYGRNSFSGAINYVTAKPTDTFEGLAEMQYGSHNKVLAKASVSGPLIDGVLKGRAAVGYDSFDGSYNNQFKGVGAGSKIGGFTYETFNGSLVWTPTDRFEGEVGLYVSNDNPYNSAIKSVAANCEDTNSLLPNRNPTVFVKYINYCGTFQPVGRDGISVIPQATGEDRDLVRGHLSLKWTTDYGTFVSLTGYSKLDQSYYVDGSRGVGEGANFAVIKPPFTTIFPFGPGGPPASAGSIGVFQTGLLQVGSGTQTKELSQELRFTSDPAKHFRYSVGVNYYDTKKEDHFSDGLFSTKALPADGTILCLSCRLAPGSTTLWYDPAGGALPIFATYFDGTGGFDFRPINNETKAPSGFAYVDFDLTTALTLRIEGRYTSEKRSFGNTVTGLSGDKTFGLKNGRVTLDYKPAENWTVYGILGHAEKSGGFDAKTVQFVPNVNVGVPGSFDPEQNDGVELGVKAELLDRRVSVDFDVYHYKWKDIAIPQVVTEVVNPATGVLTPIITPTAFNRNAGDATNQGAEFSVRARVTEYVTGSLGLSYIDAKYDNAKVDTFKNFPSLSPTGDVSGNELLRTSKFQVAASLGYKAPVRANLDWYLRGDLAYRDKQYADAANEAILPSNTTVNMQLGLQSDRWTLEFWVRNLTNEDGPTGAYRDICFTNALCSGQFFRTPSPNSSTPAGTAGSSTLFNGYRYTVTYPRLREFGLTYRWKF
jgi:iron complex outermembrane receptor protein